jgi:sulfite reductase (NADPH) flavoprotein alpha-component
MTCQIQIIMATQTGGAEDVATDVRDMLKQERLKAEWHDLADTDDITFLKKATLIIGVVSTWGDGEAPDDAVPFFENLREGSSLDLPQTPLAIMGLGDSGYDIFCGCGKELERELIRHGGRSILPRVDCDTWFDDELEKWLSDLKSVLLPAQVAS